MNTKFWCPTGEYTKVKILPWIRFIDPGINLLTTCIDLRPNKRKLVLEQFLPLIITLLQIRSGLEGYSLL
jgi:hypothetical protein